MLKSYYASFASANCFNTTDPSHTVNTSASSVPEGRCCHLRTSAENSQTFWRMISAPFALEPGNNALLRRTPAASIEASRSPSRFSNSDGKGARRCRQPRTCTEAWHVYGCTLHEFSRRDGARIQALFLSHGSLPKAAFSSIGAKPTPAAAEMAGHLRIQKIRCLQCLPRYPSGSRNGFWRDGVRCHIERRASSGLLCRPVYKTFRRL